MGGGVKIEAVARINSCLKIRTTAETFSVIRAKQLELVNRKPLSDANLKFKRTKVFNLRSDHLKDTFHYKEQLKFIPMGFCWCWNFTWIQDLSIFIYSEEKKKSQPGLTTTSIQKFVSHRWLGKYPRGSFFMLVFFLFLALDTYYWLMLVSWTLISLRQPTVPPIH